MAAQRWFSDPWFVSFGLSEHETLCEALNAIECIECERCVRFRARTIEQLMGPLPAVRLSPTRPFTYTGVDYAGPFLLKATKLRGGPGFTRVMFLSLFAL